MNEPVRILSDLHLGHKISRISDVATLRPLIAGAATVVFNGDTWQELATQFYQQSRKMLDELVTLCREEGAEAVFLSGNHDPGWEGPGWVELAEARIVIIHGDTLLEGGSPWKRENLVSSQRIWEIWKEHPDAAHDVVERIRVAREISRKLCTVEHPTGRSFLLRAWDAAVPPVRALKMLEAWFTQGTEGERFCTRYFPQAEFLIIGHFHRGGCWLRNGRRIINTGSFMAPGGAHWVEWKDGFLRWGIIAESPGECRMGRTLDVWRL